MVLSIRQANVLAQIPAAPLATLTRGTKVVILPAPNIAGRVPTLRPGRLGTVMSAETGGYRVQNLTGTQVSLLPRVGEYRPLIRADEHFWGFHEDGTVHEVVATQGANQHSTMIRGHLPDRPTNRTYRHWVAKVDAVAEAARAVREVGRAALGVRVDDVPDLPLFWRERVERIAKEFAEANDLCAQVDRCLDEIFSPVARWRVSVTSDDGGYELLDPEGKTCAYHDEREELVKLAKTLNELTPSQR